MNFEVQYIDVSPYLAAGTQPIIMIERSQPLGHQVDGGSVINPAELGRLGTFWVPLGSLLADQAVDWSMTETGQYVRVPMAAYRTNEKALATLVGLAVQIGMVAVDSLRQYTSDRPLSVTLLIGHDCPVTQDNQAFRCFLGVAIRIK